MECVWTTIGAIMKVVACWRRQQGSSIDLWMEAIGSQQFQSSRRMSSCVTDAISVLTRTYQLGGEGAWKHAICTTVEIGIIAFSRLGSGSLVFSCCNVE